MVINVYPCYEYCITQVYIQEEVRTWALDTFGKYNEIAKLGLYYDTWYVIYPTYYNIWNSKGVVYNW